MSIRISNRPSRNGFTLVELLIVVIILAILAAIVVPQFAASTDDAKASSADATLANLRAAIDLYYQQHGEYPGAKTGVPTAACTGTAGGGLADSDTAVLAQLSLYTDSDGGSCSKSDATNHKYGPYLKKGTLPADPFTGSVSTLEVVATGDLVMNASTVPPAGPGGWKYDTKTGKIIVNLVAEQSR